MSYQIIVDSCCELPQDFRQSVNCTIIPLGIYIGDDYSINDDDDFDQAAFLKVVAESSEGPKSHCASPEAFMNAIREDCDRIYMITLSANLSGSYNSAELGRQLYLDEHPGSNKKIYVFNSRSASCGETQIAYWIRDLENRGMDFDAIIRIIEAKTDKRITYFVLETLEVLRKNGRLSNIKAFIASALNIKPVMAGTIEGTIVEKSKARGMKKALSQMVDLTLSEVKDTSDRILMISHCNNPTAADAVLKNYLSKASFKDYLIMDTRGISSMYASDGGIIVTF